MVVRQKHHERQVKVGFKKVLNKEDPFDRLILDLGKQGVLDVSVVGLDDYQGRPYSQKPVVHRGKHGG